MQVKINLHGQPMPVVHGEWVDLFTAEDVQLYEGDFKMISLGYQMQLPEGYYAHVLPRSSTCKRHGILMANSIGVIENTYCGPEDIWHFPAYAIRDTFIPKGSRICQFCLMKQREPVEFVEAGLEDNTNRGGLGSTGK